MCFGARALAHIPAKPARGLDPRVDAGSPTRLCADQRLGRTILAEQTRLRILAEQTRSGFAKTKPTPKNE
jgi:hypothetical protein